MTRLAIASLTLCATLLGGCAASSENYPSLAIRDVERAEGKFAPVPVPTLDVPPVAVDLTGGLPARLATLTAQAQKAHGDFLATAPKATRLADAAMGSAVGSDIWASAQVALAELDSARSHSAVALGELDTLYVAASVEASKRDTIVTARDTVAALVADEDATLERLRAKVR